MKVLLVFNDFHWTIQIEVASMREERLGGKGFDKTIVWNEYMYVYYKFPCRIKSDVQASRKVHHIKGNLQAIAHCCGRS